MAIASPTATRSDILTAIDIKSMVIGDGKADTEGYWFPYSEATLSAVAGSVR